MKWLVKLHEVFKIELTELPQEVQSELLAHAILLEQFGPQLGRPTVDTLKGSSYSNMKELRFKVNNGVWRVAFAYDPKRQAIILIAGNKSGVSEKRFYKELIKKAENRFKNYLEKENL